MVDHRLPLQSFQSRYVNIKSVHTTRPTVTQPIQFIGPSFLGSRVAILGTVTIRMERLRMPLCVAILAKTPPLTDPPEQPIQHLSTVYHTNHQPFISDS